MLSAVIMGALLLAAPPPPPPDDRDANRPSNIRGFGMRPKSTQGDDGKPTFRPRDWGYPHAASLRSGGVEPYDHNLFAFTRNQSTSRTADPFDTVRDWYRQLAHLPAGSGDVRGENAEAIDGSYPGRKVQINVVTRQYERWHVSVLISRGDDEAWTYIKFTSIYDPPEPKPVGP
jgi:hypothetical protein